MSGGSDATMWGTVTKRNFGGFKNKRFNNVQGEIFVSRNVESDEKFTKNSFVDFLNGRVHVCCSLEKGPLFDDEYRARNDCGYKQKISFAKVRRKNYPEFGKRLDENFTISVGSDNENRRVMIGSFVAKETGRRSNKSASYRSGTGQRFYKPASAIDGWDQNLPSNPSHGYKIKIPYGQNLDKDFVLNSLHNLIAPDLFVPIMYTVNDNSVVFWVDDRRISERLRDCDKVLTTSNGNKMMVSVTPGFPRYELDDALKNAIKTAVSKKYVTERNALDLSRFHHNPDLVDDYYCSLTRSPIMVTALKIVTTALPHLVELSLDNNQLHSLDNLYLLKKLSSLRILGLCNNRIMEMDQLNSIMVLQLEELRLAGNPVTEKYTERQDEYVSDIRQRFPDLLRLDGVVVRQPIGFDLAEDRFVQPPFQRFYAPNDSARVIAVEFLRQYFQIFDSENRQPLLDAYDEQATFSMTVALPYTEDKCGPYASDSRNLCKVIDVPRRRKMLKQGRLPVVAHITELPRIQHDYNSFTMDIGLVTERMMLVTVTGMFREPATASQPIRYFTRTFLIVPRGGGYCIMNEMLQITKPTKSQEHEAFRSNASIATDTTATTTTTATAMVCAAPTVHDESRKQMTLALRERTNMTLEWTLKCLNDVQWNLDTALAAFQACHSRGEIPPDAFER